MSEKIIIKVRDILQNLCQQRGINISKIILYGSYAKKIQREDSDIDIIVISKNFRNKSIFEKAEITAGIDRELVRRTQKPFDILYYSDIEWVNSNSLIIDEAKKNSKILYG